VTPPPPQQQQQQLGSNAGAKRKREVGGGSEGGSLGSAGASAGTAAAAAAAAGGGQLAPRWAPHQLDAQGVPTTDGIIEALRALGPMPTERLGLLNEHLRDVGPEGKALLKKRLLQVAKVDNRDGRKFMVLK
jgi:hypothetical protein